MSMKSILAEELLKISLPKNELLVLEKTAKDFIASLKAKGIKAYVGGSLAKGTMVNRPGKQDVDIFVVFDYSEDILGLEKVLKKISLPGELKKVHGSRDYFQIICNDLILEVIPVVKNRDPETAENVTDISLSHVKYVGSKVKKNPKIADEIKLAKAFCQAQRCYGAESYIHGFSGYSLEVLVIHFGGFVKFLKNVNKKRVLDPLKYFRGEREVLNELNSSKLQSPIVVIDPTYKYRNVNAGLGSETFEKFISVAKEFLRLPSLKYFERQPIDVAGLKKFAKAKDAKFVEIDLKTNRQEGDIAGTKCKKFLHFFIRELGRKQQAVLRHEFDYDGGQSAKGYIVVVEKTDIEVRGPSAGLEDAVNSFRKAKGARAFERKKFWWYKEKISVKKVFESIKRVEKEMGASGKLV
jgi:tRNA nucleotidyltransferase (CCA-adding enzyme)